MVSRSSVGWSRSSVRRDAFGVVALISAFAVGSVACGESVSAEPPHTSAPNTVSRPAVPLQVASSPPAEAVDSNKPFTSWTEPAAAAALLAGKAWPRADPDALSCVFESPQQSCIPGEEAVLFGCVEDCNSGCHTCGKECTTTLDTCRATCAKTAPKEESGPRRGTRACELSCASATGQCLDRCVTRRDRCKTGDCAQVVGRYQKQVASNYGCKAKGSLVVICQKARDCIDRCTDEACQAKCLQKHAQGCDEDFQTAAKMGACQAFDTNI